MQINYGDFVRTLHKVGKYNTWNCSICGYFMSYQARGETLVYDSGCDCIAGDPNIVPVPENDIDQWIISDRQKEDINNFISKHNLAS